MKDLADEVEAPHVSYVILQTSRGFWSAFMTNLRESKMFKVLKILKVFSRITVGIKTSIYSSYSIYSIYSIYHWLGY
jgi:hypothetical protein